MARQVKTRVSRKRSGRRAFVLMPFKHPFDTYYRAIFKPALEQAGYRVSRADVLWKSGCRAENIERLIEDAIGKCHIILADISGANANVLYELGRAHALRKPTIIVARVHDAVPFDLQQRPIIFYDWRVAWWERELRRGIRLAAESVGGNGHGG